jgi:hypothetical protein
MVIPPEQLPPKERIFDLIDSIQSKISSQEYLNLMNTAQQLVQAIEDGEQEEISAISNSSSTDGDQAQIYERNSQISDSSSSDSEIEEISDDTPCDCCSRFAYPEDFPISGSSETYRQMFCRGIRIFDCENFRRLCQEYPLFNNLIEPQNIPFADSETYAPYESPKVKMMFSIFITLNSMFVFRRHKIIISLILFDFAMKNIQFMADYNRLIGQGAYEKLISFMYEDDFLVIAEEFNINLENWRFALERAIAPPLIN